MIDEIKLAQWKSEDCSTPFGAPCEEHYFCKANEAFAPVVETLESLWRVVRAAQQINDNGINEDFIELDKALAALKEKP